MSTVAITGAGGYIGQRLILDLENRDWCTRIMGTDIVEPKIESRKLSFLNKDIREHSLIDFWKGERVETVVHLAFIFDPMHDERRMYDVNVNGTLNILRICEELKIRHVVVASSATAYGAWPDNPEPLKEEDPIRIFPSSFNYAHHKGLVEQHCAQFMKGYPDVTLNMVRPCIVFGPNTDNYLVRYLDALPFVPLPDGRDPHFQYVHEDDLVRLFSLLIEKRVEGAFNVAGDGVIRSSEIGAMMGKRGVKVPLRLFYGLVWLLWHLRVRKVEAPAGIVHYMAYPWVVDTTRARELLGWKPRYTSRETLRIMLEAHGHKPHDRERGPDGGMIARP